MSTVLQNFPFVPQNEEQMRAVQDRRDAQMQLKAEGRSDRFIAVRLVEMFAPDWRERLHPTKVAKVLRNRIGVGGNKVQLEVQIKDEPTYFDYDSQIGQHVGWIYDDDKGYNRELLASHFFNGLYEIMDETIRAEIEKVAIKKRDEAQSATPEEDEKPLSDSEIKNMSAETIDEQIAYLKKQKAAVLAQKKPEPEPTVGRDPVQNPKNIKRGPKRKSALVL